MSIKNAIFKIFNGSAWDEYHMKTNSGQVQHTPADGDQTTVKDALDELNSNFARLDSDADLGDGRAFKIRMDAMQGAALTFGCWAPGIYPYRNYASGAPSDWNGFLLCVKVPYGSESATSRWIKVAFEYGGDVYLLAQESDGSGTWKKIGGA